MKYTKLLMPIAVATTAIMPITMISSCGGNKEVQTTITTGDSVGVYKFKLNSVPKDKKVAVAIANKSTDQEQVYLYGDPTSNVTESFDVSDDGTVEVPVGYYLAPSQSATSQFNITFNYKTSVASVEETVKDVAFNYNVDYGAELVNGDYPVQTAKATWGEDVAAEYTTDVLNNPNIFQNDARYSTSQRIKAAVGSSFTDLESFKAYFNDIVQEDDGIHVHMNYQLKGTKDTSSFKFIQGDTTWEFSKFDFSFTYETPNGYNFQVPASSNADYKILNIVDPLGSSLGYKLDGRFKGSFHYKRTSTSGSNEKDITYDNLIDNYNLFPKNDLSPYTDAQVCGMLSFGIIHLTYGFNWAEEPVLSIMSSYAKNA